MMVYMKQQKHMRTRTKKSACLMPRFRRWGIELFRQFRNSHIRTLCKSKIIRCHRHNISNVNTPGYSRQNAIQASSIPQAIGYSGSGARMQKGTGVDVLLIQQYRDEFLDIKMRRANKELGYWESKQMGVEDLEAIFNDLSEEGIQSAMENFWVSWDQLSKPTGRLTSRALVKESAIALVESLRHADPAFKKF